MRVVPLRYDVSFKKAFGEVEVFNAFVCDVLGMDFRAIELQRSPGFYKQYGPFQYDLIGEDPDQQCRVQIQHLREADFFHRILGHHLKSLTEQLQSREDSQRGKSVFSIVLLSSLPKDRCEDFGRLDVSFEARDEHQQPRELFPHRLIFLDPHQATDAMTPALREWLDAIVDSLDGEADPTDYANPHIQKALELAKERGLTPEELAQAKDESAWERAKRESREEGRREGLQIAKRWGRVNGVQKLLEQGLGLGEVMEILGISQEELEQLLEEFAARPAEGA